MIDIHRRTTYFFVLVSLGHVLLISTQVQSKSGMPLIQHFTLGAFGGIQRGASSTGGAIGDVWHRYVALWGVSAENERLRAEIARLHGQVQEQAALAGKSLALEAALTLQATMPQRTLAARVIAGEPAPGALTITIDRGTADGLVENLGVIAPGGVVGRVMGQPAAHTARVQLLTGRNAGAGAVLEQAVFEGVVIGGGDGPALRMQYVPNSYDVKAGERVLTSGHDRVFPGGLLIGTVEKVERGAGMHKLIAIRPAVNFGHLDIVLVLLDAPASEPTQPTSGSGQ